MRIFSLLVAILWCISGDAVAGGAVVSTTPDYPDTDRSVQLRQLHPLQLHPLQLQLLQQQPQKQHPIRENALMLGVGYTNILDTYLSPEKYRGTDVRFISIIYAIIKKPKDE